MLFDTSCFREFASHLKKNALHKNVFFEISIPLIYALCFLQSAARSLKRTKKHRGIEIRFLGPLAHFEVEGGRNFGSGYVSQNSRFYHVLSVSVVPLESVIESVML